MTDNEIIKALECCQLEYDKNCKECAYNKYSRTGCSGEMRKNALDLINRKKTEIERLKKGWKADVIETANAKAEAYKECIEKVKEELRNIAKIEWQDNYCYLVGTAFFDNLLKEMVGDSNAG